MFRNGNQPATNNGAPPASDLSVANVPHLPGSFLQARMSEQKRPTVHISASNAQALDPEIIPAPPKADHAATISKLKKGKTAPKMKPEEYPASEKSAGETSSHFGGEDEADFRKELERLQIATIYSLVEEVPAKKGGDLNMLFLTNSQANSFDFTDIDKVMNAMNMAPRPKLVVTIMKSYVHCGANHYMDSVVPEDDMFTSHCYIGEKDSESYEETAQKMALFLKDHVLPICIKTNALVLLHDNSCALSEAFGHICHSERQKRNGVLPFTVLSIVGGHMLANRAENDDESLARTIRRGSRRWKQYNNMMMDVLSNPFAIRDWRADFPNGLTHAILVSSVNDEKMKVDFSAYKKFKSALVDRLSRDLPSIGIVSYSFGGDSYSVFSDYVGRKLPLILIDSRPVSKDVKAKSHAAISAADMNSLGLRSVSDNLSTTDLQKLFLERARAHLFKIEEGLATAQTWNFYEAATLSFLHSQLEEFAIARLKAESQISSDLNDKKWLFMAIAEKRRAADAEGSEGTEESPENVLATQFVHLFMELNLKQDDNRRNFQIKVYDEFLDAARLCETVDDFSELLEETTMHWEQSNFFVGPEFDDRGDARGGYGADYFCKEYPEMFIKAPLFKDGRLFGYGSKVVDSEDREENQVTLERCKEAAESIILRRRAEVLECKKPVFPVFDFMSVHEIITSPFSFSGNVGDTSKLSAALAKIARIDRLPTDNSLVALNALKFSWDAVDICNHVASKMKTITKISYITILLIGFVIGGLAVIHLNDSERLSKDDLDTSTSALGIMCGFLAGITSIINPWQKWTRLRGAALAIECEAWRFRTRTGVYSENTEDDPTSASENSPELILQARVESIKLQVLKSAGVLSSHFMSLFEFFDDPKQPSIYCHGQYKDCGVTGTFGSRMSIHASVKANAESAKVLFKDDLRDDFFSPCHPSAYLKHRVKVVSEFYQKRLPVYSRIKTVNSTILLIGNFSGVLLALLDISSWVAIFTAAVGVLTAWNEFHGTASKITRYSDVLTQIDSTMLWWSMLTPVDQSNMSIISELIDRCESAFRDERQAWVSMNIDADKKGKKDKNSENKSGGDNDSQA